MDLTPAALSKEAKAGKLRPVYYLFGEDAAGKAAILETVKKHFAGDAFNVREFSGDPEEEASAIVSECSTLPVFAERRLVVVKNPKIPAAAREVLTAYLKDPLPTTTLVLLSEDRKPDARDGLAKAAASSGGVCVFAALREEEAQARLKAEAAAAGKTLSDEAAAALVAEAGADWLVLKQELEKTLLFSSAHEISRADALAVLGYRKAADPFLLSRLVADRKVKEALTQLRRLLDGGKSEDAFRALGQISASVSRQVKAKRLLKAGLPPESILGKLRLHPHWDRDYLSGLKRFSEERLVRDLKRCVEAEADLKSKSWLDPRLELERLLVDLGGPDYLAATAA